MHSIGGEHNAGKYRKNCSFWPISCLGRFLLRNQQSVLLGRTFVENVIGSLCHWDKRGTKPFRSCIGILLVILLWTQNAQVPCAYAAASQIPMQCIVSTLFCIMHSELLRTGSWQVHSSQSRWNEHHLSCQSLKEKPISRLSITPYLLHNEMHKR